MSILDSILRKSADEHDPPYYAPLRENDYVAAVPLLQAAIRREDAHAMAIFATLLAFGRGVEKNMQDAADWFRQSAARGEPAGQTAYGACLASGLGVERDDEEAAYWLYRAAQGGYAAATEMLSNVVMRNQAVVGKHFSMEDFLLLMRTAHRPTGTVLH